MTTPKITQSVTDGASNAVAGDGADVVAFFGACSLGTPLAVYSFTQLQSLRAALGYGPLVEEVANTLRAGKGKLTALVVPVTKTAGSVVMGTQTGTGLATIVDNSSAPNDDYDVVIKIVIGGLITVATMKISLDGGRTYGAEVATSASYTVPNTGVLLTLSSTPGAFVADDTYPLEAKGPTFTVINLGLAIQALLDDGRLFEMAHIVGIPADAATAASVAAAIDSKLETAEARYQYAIGVCEAPEGVTNAALKTAVVSTTAPRAMLTGGFCQLTDALTLRRVKRPAAWPVFARLASSPIHEHPGRFASGPLAQVDKLKSLQDEVPAYSYHDEFITPELDDGRITSLRTWPGVNGVYITRGKMLAAVGSDFADVQARRVMNRALRIGYLGMRRYENDTVRVNAITGFILEKDALGIEADLTSKLTAALVNTGHASAVQFLLRRDNNILSTNELLYRVRIVRLGYAEFVTGEYGFLNPALEVIG